MTNVASSAAPSPSEATTESGHFLLPSPPLSSPLFPLSFFPARHCPPFEPAAEGARAHPIVVHSRIFFFLLGEVDRRTQAKRAGRDLVEDVTMMILFFFPFFLPSLLHHNVRGDRRRRDPWRLEPLQTSSLFLSSPFFLRVASSS